MRASTAGKARNAARLTASKSMVVARRPEQQHLLGPGRSFVFAISPDAVAYGGADEAMTAIGDTRSAPNHIPVRMVTIDAETEQLWHRIERHSLDPTIS